MSQQDPNSFPIDPFTVSGTELATRINELNNALKSSQSGTSRPSYAVQGFKWVDITTTKNVEKFYTGTIDLSLIEYDTVANKAILNGGASFTDKSKSIIHKFSEVADAVPLVADMVKGEFYLNSADKIIFFLDDIGGLASISNLDVADYDLIGYRGELLHNITTDADYTLIGTDSLYRRIKITDTGVILTTGRNTIMGITESVFIFENSTAQTLTVKTSAGTGIAVTSGTIIQLRCDGTNIVLFEENAIGYLQTWQDVKASRALGVTYTNTTDKPIQVIICLTGTTSGTSASLLVDGIDVLNATVTSSFRNSFSAIVPAGSTYSIGTGSYTLAYWAELR